MTEPTSKKIKGSGVAQLVERSIRTPKICSLNLVMGNFIFLNAPISASFCLLSSFQYGTNQFKLIKAQMVCLGLEPGPAGWQAQMNPLSYGGTHWATLFTSNCIKNVLKRLKNKEKEASNWSNQKSKKFYCNVLAYLPTSSTLNLAISFTSAEDKFQFFIDKVCNLEWWDRKIGCCVRIFSPSGRQAGRLAVNELPL